MCRELERCILWWMRGDAQGLADKRAAMNCVRIQEVTDNNQQFSGIE
jgi:hypothetical protein